MGVFRGRIVLFPRHRRGFAVLVAAVVSWYPSMAAAQAVNVTGPYLAVDVGQQHVIGGSLVDGVDTLQDDVRAVTSLSAGLRGRLGRLMFGGELGRGWLDGRLERRDPGTTVQYDTSSQWHWALTAGAAVSDSTLIYVYVSEVTRAFDVTITRSGGAAEQDDEQGLLRVGVSAERRLRGPLRARVAAGTSRADFGGRQTNIEPRRRMEVSLGLVWQF